jgi:GrpB-like predicted nucleotidyltransferase (UPF0157 family)
LGVPGEKESSGSDYGGRAAGARGPIMTSTNTLTILEYDPRWPAMFALLRDRVAAALGEEIADRIEHVGSTSVPGMVAKPIIDIDVLLRGAADLPLAIERLAAIGYEHQGDRGIVGREAFRKDDASLPAHHLYVCPPNSPEFARHVALRDYLRSHAHVARAYSELKRTLYPRFRDDRAGYQSATDAFVSELVRRACELSHAESFVVRDDL